MSRFASALLLVGAVGVGALGCTPADAGTIQIITDEEAGTFTQSPVPTELTIVGVESPDASTPLATAQLPTSTIDLGQLSESAPAVSINVSGLDATRTRRVFGASLPLEYGALVDETIPIFVQRTGAFARLPGPLSDSREAPALAILQGEFLLIAGGSDSSLSETSQLFDFLAFGAWGSPPSLPTVPKSIALTATVAWLIDDTVGWYFDFSSTVSPPSSIELPATGTFADVAGGATVIDPTGAQYIVGATRTSGTPTDKVLKIDLPDLTNTTYPNGTPSWLTLTAPRLGAAAAWVDGMGLVVAGGNGDPSAAGIEVVTPSASTPLSFSGRPDDRLGRRDARRAPHPSGRRGYAVARRSGGSRDRPKLQAVVFFDVRDDLGDAPVHARVRAGLRVDPDRRPRRRQSGRRSDVRLPALRPRGLPRSPRGCHTPTLAPYGRRWEPSSSSGARTSSSRSHALIDEREREEREDGSRSGDQEEDNSLIS